MAVPTQTAMIYRTYAPMHMSVKVLLKSILNTSYDTDHLIVSEPDVACMWVCIWSRGDGELYLLDVTLSI